MPLKGPTLTQTSSVPSPEKRQLQVPSWREHGKCAASPEDDLDPATLLAAGPQPILAVTVEVTVEVGTGSVVVPAVTLAQQAHALENWPGEEQWAEAKVGTADGRRVELPMRVIVVVSVVLRVVKAAEVEGEGTGLVVNFVTVLVTVLFSHQLSNSRVASELFWNR